MSFESFILPLICILIVSMVVGYNSVGKAGIGASLLLLVVGELVSIGIVNAMEYLEGDMALTTFTVIAVMPNLIYVVYHTYKLFKRKQKAYLIEQKKNKQDEIRKKIEELENQLSEINTLFSKCKSIVNLLELLFLIDGGSDIGNSTIVKMKAQKDEIESLKREISKYKSQLEGYNDYYIQNSKWNI